MAQSDPPHVLVLGGGPAGYAGAFHAADLGLKVTLVDLEPNPGGVCLYRGCIPSKALLHVTRTMTEAADAAACGITYGKPKISLPKLRAWKNDVVEKLTAGLGTLTRSRGIDFIHGRGAFVDAHTVKVNKAGGGTTTVRFDYGLIATGSVPLVPAALRGGGKRTLDSTDALAVRRVPKRLLVIGGGYIGLEMAMVYSALGSRVTVVEMAGGLVPQADRDLVEPLQAELEKRLEAIHTHTQVAALRESKKGVRAELSGRNVERPSQTFDQVLVAVGRRAQTDTCRLEKAGVALDDRGFIVTDEQRRTGVNHLFAVGDVAGEPMLAHKASYEARMATEVMAGHPAACDAQSIPAVMFTDPEVAWCGLTETQAQAQNLPIKVARFPWGASGRALTMNRKDGLTKLIAAPTTGQILGVGVVGPGAGELLAEGSLAVEMGLRMEDLKLTVHAHPTLSETVMEAAEAFFGSSTHFYTKL